jgi:2-keto-4-pentenoate hydratase
VLVEAAHKAGRRKDDFELREISWKFSAADTVAAFCLHGALLIGPGYSIAAHAEDWDRTLSTFEIDLKRNGAIADHGRAMNLLGGPVSALRHLVDILAGDQINPPLAAGEIVTTGTLTRALPVSAGETWTTELAGVALDGRVMDAGFLSFLGSQSDGYSEPAQPF